MGTLIRPRVSVTLTVVLFVGLALAQAQQADRTAIQPADGRGWIFLGELDSDHRWLTQPIFDAPPHPPLPQPSAEIKLLDPQPLHVFGIREVKAGHLDTFAKAAGVAALDVAMWMVPTGATHGWVTDGEIAGKLPKGSIVRVDAVVLMAAAKGSSNAKAWAKITPVASP